MLILPAFVSILIFTTTVNSQRYEFDICKVGTHGRPNHICRNIHDCPTALEAIRQNRIPSVCGFDGDTPIVCCELSNLTIPSTTTTTTSTTTNTTRIPSLQIPSNSQTRLAISIVNDGNMHQIQANAIHNNLESDKWTATNNGKNPTMPHLGDRATGCWRKLPKEFPHMALIGYGANIKTVEWKCGGSLISERFVLTAAHCADVTNLPKWIRLGELDYTTNTDDAKPEDFEIIEHIVHPNYHSIYHYDDIALLKLSREVIFNEYIRPVCLHTNSGPLNQKLIATGWGTIGAGHLGSEKLLKVDLWSVDKATCDKSFVGDRKLNHGINADKMICAGDPGSEKDTCQGDSGGPIQFKINDEPCMYAQVGITSFGNAFCIPPGVYTRVYNYLPWIQSIVWS